MAPVSCDPLLHVRSSAFVFILSCTTMSTCVSSPQWLAVRVAVGGGRSAARSQHRWILDRCTSRLSSPIRDTNETSSHCLHQYIYIIAVDAMV